MTATASIDSPRAKLARAAAHRQTLYDAIVVYAQTQPVLTTRPVLSDNGDMFGIFAKIDPSPPTELGVILGDYIHNLRGALDHLVNQLAVLAGQAPGRKHQFPIVFKDTKFDKAANVQLRGLRPEHVDPIRKLQPFNHPARPEEHPLALLHWLSNTDKHEIVHATATSVVDADPATSGFRLTKGTGTLGTPQVHHAADAEGNEPILRVSLDPPDRHAEAEWYGHVDVALVFGERRARERTVKDLQGFVTAIVEHFAPDFP
jgi:hypothetical protein